MVDCNPERIVYLWNTWMKLIDIPVLNVLLITGSLVLHVICILKKTSLMGA